MDAIVAEAERLKIGLIPSLFWFYPTVPDLVGENMDGLGNSQSRSMEFIREYTRQMARRYRESPALWAWELGNEYNLSADLPNAAEHRPAIAPDLGTPPSRSEADDLSSAEAVREVDPRRAIFAGHAAPRPSAWHNTRSGTWERDTAEQCFEILARDHPDPIDALSIHLYPDASGIYPGPAEDWRGWTWPRGWASHCSSENSGAPRRCLWRSSARNSANFCAPSKTRASPWPLSGFTILARRRTIGTSRATMRVVGCWRKSKTPTPD
jgi:hypothetical protein